MYTKKNKAISFVEIIICIGLTLILGTISFSAFSVMNKTYRTVLRLYKREKEIITFKELINSYIKWNESIEIRIVEISPKDEIKSLEKIFKNKSSEKGNLLLIKVNTFNGEDKFATYYRCFLFFENKLRMAYYSEEDINKIVKIFGETVVLEDCSGEFSIIDKNLKYVLEDKKEGKQYEEIIF